MSKSCVSFDRRLKTSQRRDASPPSRKRKQSKTGTTERRSWIVFFNRNLLAPVSAAKKRNATAKLNQEVREIDKPMPEKRTRLATRNPKLCSGRFEAKKPPMLKKIEIAQS